MPPPHSRRPRPLSKSLIFPLIPFLSPSSPVGRLLLTLSRGLGTLGTDQFSAPPGKLLSKA